MLLVSERDRCDLMFVDLVGESDVLHGQMQPPAWDQIQAAEPDERGLRRRVLPGGAKVSEGTRTPDTLLAKRRIHPC
jgi:hypothetical protein